MKEELVVEIQKLNLQLDKMKFLYLMFGPVV